MMTRIPRYHFTKHVGGIHAAAAEFDVIFINCWWYGGCIAVEFVS